MPVPLPFSPYSKKSFLPKNKQFYNSQIRDKYIVCLRSQAAACPTKASG
jgi:hypothetical protein